MNQNEIIVNIIRELIEKIEELSCDNEKLRRRLYGVDYDENKAGVCLRLNKEMRADR